MEIVDLPERRFTGISMRTSNDAVPETPNDSISGLWVRFGSEVSPKIQKDICYGVYTDYASDQNGEYRVSATVELEPDESVPDGLDVLTTPAGRYMVFRGVGSMPEIVASTWGLVWSAFEQADMPYRRTFVGDLEAYPSETEVIIYVGITDAGA